MQNVVQCLIQDFSVQFILYLALQSVLNLSLRANFDFDLSIKSFRARRILIMSFCSRFRPPDYLAISISHVYSSSFHP